MDRMTLSVPPSGQVDVWITQIDHISDLQRRTCEALLSEEERIRLSKFLVEDAGLQFLISRCLVRTTLSRYAPKKAGDWEFVVNTYGRPRLADGQVATPLHFNLSHTAGMAVCAICRSQEIGIDVENVERGADFMRLAQGSLANTENARLALAGDRVKGEVFYQHWTLKEAYIKARGMGFSLPLKAFWFEFDDEEEIIRIAFSAELPDDPKRWHFQCFSPTDRHRVAVAASFTPNSTDIRTNLRVLSVADLFERKTPPLSSLSH